MDTLRGYLESKLLLDAEDPRLRGPTALKLGSVVTTASCARCGPP
jgi:hypothetical protein